MNLIYFIHHPLHPMNFFSGITINWYKTAAIIQRIIIGSITQFIMNIWYHKQIFIFYAINYNKNAL